MFVRNKCSHLGPVGLWGLEIEPKNFRRPHHHHLCFWFKKKKMRVEKVAIVAT
jgi:hypothetical protein